MFSALLRSRRLIVAAISVLALAVAVGACGTSDKKSSGGGGGSSKSGSIGLLLPETKTTRYEAFDHPYFAAKLKELCSGCKLLYANSNQDASQQQSQAESMLTQGAKVTGALSTWTAAVTHMPYGAPACLVVREFDRDRFRLRG